MTHPPISFQLDGYPLLLPPHSQLPGIKHSLPHYGTNIARLAKTVAAKYPDLSILDIGANVGDTVATLRSAVPCPILCVEGCDDYLELLHKNLRQFSDVEVEPAFVGGDTPSISAKIIIERGTGILHPAPDAPTTEMRNLDTILTRHPRFSNARLWKIDTDGWDSHILQQNIKTVQKLQPILFFEYDPHFFAGPLADGAQLFPALRAAGYHDLLFWENTGDFFLRTDLTREEELQDLHQAVSGRNNARYWDIAAFPTHDTDLATHQRQQEITFFQHARPPSPPPA